jgi:hypothetical protein
MRANVNLRRVASLSESYPVTVLIAHPVSALGALLQAGVPPKQALTRWITAARSLIEDLENAQFRARLILIPRQDGHVSLTPQASVGGLAIPGDGLPPWMAVAASALLAADSDARSVTDELNRHDQPSASGTTALSDMLAQIAILQEVFVFRKGERQAGQTVPHHQTEARLATTLHALDQMQVMIEGQLEELTQLAETEVDMRQELSRMQAQLADYNLLRSQVSTQRLTIREMHETQHLREGILGAQLINDGVRMREMQEEIAQLRIELNRVYESRSWRVTAPLRGFMQKRPRREEP